MRLGTAAFGLNGFVELLISETISGMLPIATTEHGVGIVPARHCKDGQT
jgi:hypothetical protein